MHLHCPKATVVEQDGIFYDNKQEGGRIFHGAFISAR